MNRKMLRKMSALLALLVVLAMLAGCKTDAGKSDGTSGTTASQVTGQTTAKQEEAPEPFTLTWAGVANGPVDEKSYAERAMEEAFSYINVELWPINRQNYQEQIIVRIAGGDIPDVVNVESKGMLVAFHQQGILGEVTFDQIKENMPEWWKLMKEYSSVVFLASMEEGINHGVPVMTVKTTRDFVNGWRKDWLTNVGISKVPETLEEMEQALLKFRNEDPDKNGKKDTYGFTLRGKDNIHMAAGCIFGAFGIFSNFWNKADDGTIQYGIVMDEAKQALEVLHRWYELEIIDPEFVTTDWNIAQEKWYNGKTGYLDMASYYRWFPGEYLYDGLMSVNPNAEIALAPAPKGPKGDYGYFNWGKVTGSTGFTKKFSEDKSKVASVLKLIEKLSTDRDLYLKVTYGEEGKHYNMDKEFNYPKTVEVFSSTENKGEIGNNFQFYIANALNTSWTERSDAEEYYKYNTGNVLDNVDYFTMLTKLMDSDVQAKYSADLTVLHQKAMIQFITGERPLSEFDAFVNEWMNAGGKEMTEAANAAFANYEEAMAAVNSLLD